MFDFIEQGNNQDASRFIQYIEEKYKYEIKMNNNNLSFADLYLFHGIDCRKEWENWNKDNKQGNENV